MSLTKAKDKIKDVEQQIKDFQSGKLKPIVTKVKYVDQHLLGGLYPSVILGIAALSQHGKTYELEKLQTNIEQQDDVIMFKCNWEISLFKAVVREMSKLTGKPVKEVLTQLPDEDLKKKYNEIINRYKQDNIYIQPMAVSPDTFEKELNELIEKYPDKKIVVSIDNLENVLLNGQTHKQAMDAVVRIINVAKEKHSFISFIILNQLNWDIMEREDPKNHFPRPKDIYNSSAFFKLCDVVMVKHMPFRLGINKYGVFSKQRYEYLEDKFKIESRTGSTASFDAIGKVFYHFLKSRDVPLEFDIEDLFVEAIYDAPEEDKTPVFEENKETPFF